MKLCSHNASWTEQLPGNHDRRCTHSLSDRVLFGSCQPHRIADFAAEPTARLLPAVEVCAVNCLNRALDWIRGWRDMHVVEQVVDLAQEECTLAASSRDRDGRTDVLGLEADDERPI